MKNYGLKRCLGTALLFCATMTLVSCADEAALTSDVRHGIDVQTSYSVEQSAFTRAELTTSVAKQLTYVLLDSEDAVVTYGKKTSDMGTLAIDCNPGTYTLLLCANAGDAPTVNQNGTLTFSKAGDTFSHSVSVTVGTDARSSVNAELTRAASQLVILSNDAIPADVKKISFKMEGISTIYDIAQHKGTNSTAYEVTAAVSTGIKTADGKLQAGLTQLIPAAEISDAKLTVKMLDASDSVIRTMVYENLPMKQNIKTKLTSTMFFANGGDVSISVSADWGEDLMVER